MKKSLIVLVALLTALPLINASAQKAERPSRPVVVPDKYKEFFELYQGKELSKENEEKILQTVPDDLKQKLAEIKKLNKEKYYQLLKGFPYGFASWITGAAVEGLSSVNENLSRQKELEVETELLALKYKNADQNAKAQLKKDLTEKLSELFEINEARKAEEVKQLQFRLQELTESLKARKENKQIIIDRRIQEMLGDSKYLRWN